jgi:hypothetical protein
MNTFLNIQQEFKHQREELQRQLYYLAIRPLHVRISERGNREQHSLRLCPNYHLDQLKRVSKSYNRYN